MLWVSYPNDVHEKRSCSLTSTSTTNDSLSRSKEMRYEQVMNIERRYLMATAVQEWYESLEKKQRGVRAVFGQNKVDNRIYAWIHGVRPIPPTFLAILYVNTTDRRFLMTAGEKQRSSEKNRASMPAERQWPTITQQEAEASIRDLEPPDDFVMEVERRRGRKNEEEEGEGGQGQVSPPAVWQEQPRLDEPKPTPPVTTAVMQLITAQLQLIVAALRGDSGLMAEFAADQEIIRLLRQLLPEPQATTEATSEETKITVAAVRSLSRDLRKISKLPAGHQDREWARVHLVEPAFNLYEAATMLNIQFPDEFGDLVAQFEDIRQALARTTRRRRGE
ncbi:MAG: hypothetical protein WC618_03650 [Patescibacteria group bacterium]